MLHGVLLKRYTRSSQCFEAYFQKEEIQYEFIFFIIIVNKHFPLDKLLLTFINVRT